MKTILLIPEFASSGGTRTYLKILLKFYYNENFKVILAINRIQLDQEIESLIKKYSIEYFFIPQRIIGYKSLFMRVPLHFIWDLFILIYAYYKYHFDYIVCSVGTPRNMLAAFLFPKKIIYILHTYPMERLTKFYRHILNCCLNENKIIVTVSNFSKKKICELWIDNNCEFVKCVYSFSNGTVNRLNKVVSKEMTILTLGHVIDYKNPQIWFEIAQEVSQRVRDKNVRFIWAGDGPLLSKYQKNSSECGYDIQFIGYKKNVNLLYSHTDIYFQPSQIENFSLSILDALNNEIPCIVSDVGGNPELIIEGENGFVVELDDKEKILEKFLLLINNKSERIKMGRKAKKDMNAIFQKKIGIEKCWKFITRLIML